jgi:amino acid adenylation domain-containing protein
MADSLIEPHGIVLPDKSWNATETPFPDKLLIHGLFEEQVTKTPGAVALIDGDRHYTYSEINEITNRMARALRKKRVGDESIVGCYLTRSSAIVLCTLAILKAGGAYILLDSTMPKARLDYIIGDAGPIVILSDAEHSPKVTGIPSFTIPQLLGASKNESAAKLSNTIKSTNAAYIAYTSGSTGHPKGVVITHRSTVNHACAFRKLFKLDASDRVPMMAPIAFDMAIEEMVPPLVSGCTLIVSASKFESMEKFHRDIIQNKYTILNLPAPLWHEWTEYMSSNACSIPESLRLVIAGSEEIETKTFMIWQGLPGSDEVDWVAAYGTTETTVTSTFYRSASRDDLSHEPFIPIGKPIANTRVYILNGHLREVGIGEEGELYIAGAGVARGYYNREELTLSKFLPDPFEATSEDKMYKTGDIARYLPDGNVVWLGRADSQFKLNGLRVEPGEIESVLNSSPLVSESVVILLRQGSKEADKKIVAFVVTEPGQAFDEGVLRKLAMEHLSPLMLPQLYVCVRALPLNANGKIDRKALQNYASLK